MGNALFYKEWIKTRRSVLLIALLAAGFTAYAFINAGQAFRVAGAVQVWNGVLTKDLSLLPSVMRWMPALAALLLSLSQFVPEMTDKRLKLTLHLPMGENRIVAVTLAYGIAVLAALYLLTYAVLIAGFSTRYPAEMIAGMGWKSLPWFLAGLCAYLLTAWICLEPVWRYKIGNTLAAVCLGSFFFMAAAAGGYKPFIPYLAIFALLCFAFPFYSAARFKEGAQS